MVYPYHSLIKGIQNLLNQPGFWNKCQEWRSKAEPENMRADIHHGDVWKELSSTGFLNNANSLGLMLNVDWFRPHKHSPGSVGVLYLVIIDLPREHRYKLENVLVVGILPGPTEPKLTANTFLGPLIEELKTLWNAKVRFSVHRSMFKKPIKIGLVCVTCDIPAARKIGGFMGHMANQGCSRCKKEFYKHDHLDFSGFDRNLWTPRSSDEHKKQGRDTLKETSPASQQSKCAQYGARYSVLHELEYFDCIRFFVIDPMHNLYLGTAKHMMKNVWLNENSPLFGSDAFEIMQAVVDSMITPQDIGRIPGKIGNSFSGFTADQWQNWTVVFSLYALQGILPEEHLNCWRSFVSACILLGKRTISEEDIIIGDQHLLNFLEQIVKLYGAKMVTPNMHLHGHLRECLTDFGPFHGFWCFSFERYNGVLGAYHTNNRSIEIQLMRKFLCQIKARAHNLPEVFREEFLSFFNDDQDQAQGSLKSTLDSVDSQLALQRHRNIPLSDIDSADWNDGSHIQAFPPIKDSVLDDDDIRYIRAVYTKLLGLQMHDILEIPFTIGKFMSLKLGPVIYGSLGCRTVRNSYILANWAGNAGRIDDQSSNTLSRPGEVAYFFRHRVKVRSSNSGVPDRSYQFHMARVNWYSKHPNQLAYGSSVQIWCNQFDPFGPACFIPIHRLHARFVASKGKYEDETVMVVTPLPGNC